MDVIDEIDQLKCAWKDLQLVVVLYLIRLRNWTALRMETYSFGDNFRLNNQCIYNKLTLLALNRYEIFDRSSRTLLNYTIILPKYYSRNLHLVLFTILTSKTKTNQFPVSSDDYIRVLQIIYVKSKSMEYRFSIIFIV